VPSADDVRAVVDTNVLLSGLFWSGSPHALLEQVRAGTLDGDELDASLLLLAELELVAATDRRFISTCNAIGRELCRNGRIMRYTNDDGFDAPETAFLVYNFWHIDALAAIGRRDDRGC
jgi:GH15 family glucan-1,4-alpha-glucosidase